MANLDKKDSQADEGQIRELESEMRDLQIANRVKDGIIAQLEKQQQAFADERQHYIDELMGFNRKVGELEAKLLQLAPPRELGSERDSGDD